MKLYTEEQVRQMLFDLGSVLFNNNQNGIEEGEPATHFDYIIEDCTPIELPSDEEIDKEAFQVPYDNTRGFYDLQFIKGAKWMRDKIQEITNEDKNS
jgi:hypothetical protein